MAAEQHLCRRHGRPAVASRVRLRPDGTQEVEYLCDIDLAEERMGRLGGGRSLFDDFFSDFFGEAGGFNLHRAGNNLLFADGHVTSFRKFDPQSITFHPSDISPSLPYTASLSNVDEIGGKTDR